MLAGRQYTGSMSSKPGYPTRERPRVSLYKLAPTAETKVGVEHINPVAWSIGNPAIVQILSAKDECNQLVAVDPVQLAKDR